MSILFKSSQAKLLTLPYEQDIQNGFQKLRQLSVTMANKYICFYIS